MAIPAIAVTAGLSADEAWALAQLLKRIGFSDYRTLAASDGEARLMRAAGEVLRQALPNRASRPADRQQPPQLPLAAGPDLRSAAESPLVERVSMAQNARLEKFLPGQGVRLLQRPASR